MSVAETSLEAYYTNIHNGIIGERQSRVLYRIKKTPLLTAAEYAKIFFDSEDPNYTRPRITELKDLGMIKAGGKRKCSVSGRTAMVWEVS